MARTVKSPPAAIKPPKKSNTIARMSRSQKKTTVKPAEPKNNDSVVNQDHGIDKQLTNTDRARNDDLKKATRRNKTSKVVKGARQLKQMQRDKMTFLTLHTSINLLKHLSHPY